MSRLIFVLFFISGACGLIYEVVWSRMLTLVFGRSILAVGTVLAAFMSGLAIGSYVLGKYADRSRNPFRLYALYEFGIGVTGFIASICLSRVSPLYVEIYSFFGDYPALFVVVRLFIVLALLIVPTALMGATLPILSRGFIKHSSQAGHSLGRLYAINTVGAVAGSFMAGFYLIGHFGLHWTVYLASIGNVAVGLFAWFVSSRPGLTKAINTISSSENITPLTTATDPEMRRIYQIVLWAFALSGVTSFAYEIFWTRSLVFMFGNTTYAFTLMLMAFLSGIALGGYGIGLVADKVKRPLQLFAAIEVLIGALSAVSLPLLFFLINSESVHSFMGRMSGRFGFLIFSEFGLALVLMLLPATLIGATLPLISRIFVKDIQRTGAMVGKIYAVNTLGNVFGALLPGLVIMPVMGIQKGILLMAVLNVCLALVISLSQWKHARGVMTATPVGFIIITYVLVQIPIPFQFPSDFQFPNDRVLYYKEGGLVTTKVWVNDDIGCKEISVDGVTIGGTCNTDYKQQILAHLPKLLLKKYESELSVGLGSGILIGESARHAALKRVLCVEISDDVVEGTKYFQKENFGVLSDPRASIVVDDVSSFLQITKEQYDIISADEKTADNYATNSLSYSKEYYTLFKKHLAPGGLVIQWVPTALPLSQYILVVRTFLDSFPRVMLWYFPPAGNITISNTFLVGSNERIDIDPGWMRQVMERDPGAFHGIRKYGLTSPEALLTHYIADDTTLRPSCPSGPVNSFERPYYEFYSPNEYALLPIKRVFATHSLLMSVRGHDFDRFVLNGSAGLYADRLSAAFQAEGIFFEGHGYELLGLPGPSILPYYSRAIGMAPWNMSLLNEVVSYLNLLAKANYDRGDLAGALAYLRQASEVYPESAEAHYNYGRLLWFAKQDYIAVKELEQTLALDPGFIRAHQILGTAYVQRGEIERGVEHWKTALSLDPDDIATLVDYGNFVAMKGITSEARSFLERAYRLDPESYNVVDGYARVLYLSGDVSGARRIVLKGGNYYKGNQYFEELRAKILGKS